MLPQKIVMIAGKVGKPLMRQLKRWMFRLLPYRRDSVSREGFEIRYSHGQYEYLRGISELVHYSVLIGYCHYLKPAGAILDVGCGEVFSRNDWIPVNTHAMLELISQTRPFAGLHINRTREHSLFRPMFLPIFRMSSLMSSYSMSVFITLMIL
jgi:hypothetical protein